MCTDVNKSKKGNEHVNVWLACVHNQTLLSYPDSIEIKFQIIGDNMPRLAIQRCCPLGDSKEAYYVTHDLIYYKMWPENHCVIFLS